MSIIHILRIVCTIARVAHVKLNNFYLDDFNVNPISRPQNGVNVCGEKKIQSPAREKSSRIARPVPQKSAGSE